MERILPLLLACLLASVSFFALADTESGADYYAVGDQRLVLNGRGMRKKWFLNLYRAELYLPEKSVNAKAIVAADESAALRLRIVSSLITPEKMSAATMEGFEKSTGGEMAPIRARIDRMLAVFAKGIAEGDVYDFVYRPGAGVEIIRNGGQAALIPGLDFKQALFGIWLSDNPVQQSLKQSLLGG